LSGIKKLAGQTIWYGVSSIFGRFLNYLLTPLLTIIFATADYGKITTLFAVAAFLNIIYTYGMETAYFRFSLQHDEKKVYNTSNTSIVLTTLIFTALLYFLAKPIAAYLEIPAHPEYIVWMLLIVALDTFVVMPFARLRYLGRPRKYALIKILNVLINIGLILFFLVFCKGEYLEKKNTFFAFLYNPAIGIGYVIIANLIASGVTWLMLWKEFFQFKLQINTSFWKEMMHYSWPLVIVGFGGMVNELIDRFMILKLYPGTTEQAYSQSGIYGANYKLAIIIVLFIQAFRLGAEPFFFKQAADKNAPRTYARVMKFFVIVCCFCFLLVTLFLGIWKYFMGTNPLYYTGLIVVPILMLAKIFLGIYYNLSIWYKLTNRNLTGAWITLGGAAITIIFNWIFIPVWGYLACAIATLLCYGFMMVTSYSLGQKNYPIPYAWRKLLAYIFIAVLTFGIHQVIVMYTSFWIHFFAGVVLLGLYVLFISRVEKKEFSRLPFIGRFYKLSPVGVIPPMPENLKV
jgi:O-antigen/teichoic acid export membrane protein